MEKEPQPESLATVAIKPDYPPSEVYGSEPPPAYHRSQSSAVQVAKIIAVTVVLVSVVLGGFILASAYVTANASCRELREELEMLSEVAERLPLQPEALVQEEPEARQTNDIQQQEKEKEKDASQESKDSDSDSSSESEDEEDEKPIHIRLPLQLDFDDLAGALMEQNQRSRMNCMVEKKRAEEVVDHKPKTVALPFGVNLTTDPRLERISGERMVIFCESGNMQRHIPQPQPQPQPDQQEDTIMIQPVMIPLVGNHYATHMPQQAQTMPPQRPMHPMEAMRPPMMQQEAPQDVPFPPLNVLHQIAQQIIAQRLMESQREQEEAQNTNDLSEESQQRPQGQHRFEMRPQMVPQRMPIPEEVLTQINRLPNRDMIVVQEQEQEEPQHEVRIVEQSRPNVPEYKARAQEYARGLPVQISVPMMQQEPQEQQEAASEETRPHYLQPRSIRSVDAIFKKDEAKRVKRCACDCAC